MFALQPPKIDIQFGEDKESIFIPGTTGIVEYHVQDRGDLDWIVPKLLHTSRDPIPSRILGVFISIEERVEFDTDDVEERFRMSEPTTEGKDHKAEDDQEDLDDPDLKVLNWQSMFQATTPEPSSAVQRITVQIVTMSNPRYSYKNELVGRSVKLETALLLFFSGVSCPCCLGTLLVPVVMVHHTQLICQHSTDDCVSFRVYFKNDVMRSGNPFNKTMSVSTLKA